MKILIVRPTATVMNRNSYNLQEEGIAKQYVKMGHQCNIVYYTNKKYKTEIVPVDKVNRFNIYWIPAWKIYDNAVFKSKYIKPLLEDADVIVTEEFEQLQSCILSLKYPQKVVIYHGPYDCDYKSRYMLKSKIYELFFLKAMIKKKIKFIAKSKKAKRTIEAKGFSNVDVIPVGLDLSKFQVSDFHTFVQPNQKLDKLDMLYVGSLEDRRNIPFMLLLTKELIDRNIPVNLTIVGEARNNDYFDECKKLIKKLDIENNIIYLGKKKQDELVEIYKNNPVFLLPTRYEIFGMVLLEAMLFGRIVLTTDNGGSETLIDDKVDGYILPENDINEWANILIEIFDNKVNRHIMSTCAINKVLESGTWEKSANKFLEYFKKRMG